MQPIQLSLLSASILAAVATATTSNSLSCDRVALGSESSTKWTVSCISAGSITTSAASFNPLLVQNFYVDNGEYVAATSSNLELSSTFSEVGELVSSSVTNFSLLAASGFTPAVPVTIVSTAFAQLSALQNLHLEGIPLADSEPHLVLPTSIEKISIVGCGLSNISFEFADGSALADSALTFIDLRLNDLKGVPVSLFDLPNGVSTIDLQNNTMNLSSETTAHKKQLTAWINAKVLHLDSDSLSTLEELTSTENSASDLQAHPNNLPTTSSSGSEKNVTGMEGSSNMNVVPITIFAIVIPAVLAVGITLALVVRKRRRMQDRESVGILDLPHHFDKHTRDRSETSGHFTAVESELSRSCMSRDEDPHQDTNDRGSCVELVVTPSDADHQHQASATASVGYVNLGSPQEVHEGFSLANAKRQNSHREDGDSDHSLELLSTHSTASTTSIQTRTATRKALRSALETLLAAKSNEDTPLTVNTNQYSFSPGTQIEETPIAFFVDCHHVSRSSEDASSEPAPPTQLVLKVFIEDDADLAGRESYALSILQHEDSTSAFVPRLFDDALEYELEFGNAKKIVKRSCCILVLEKPSCISLRAHMAGSREPLAQQIARVMEALRALHARGLVHGALNSDSFVVCSPDAQLKFWGLEHATRAGHKIPCPDDELLGLSHAECIAPELAFLALEQKSSSRASASLDVWSLGVMILKMYAPDRQLEEFKGCTASHEVFERLTAPNLDGELTDTCYFERSIAQFVPSNDMKDLLRRCLQRDPISRPSLDFISKHEAVQTSEREVSRATTVKSTVVPRLLSVIIEEKDTILTSGEPEREASGKDQVPDKIHVRSSEVVVRSEDTIPEPLPPSLWLFVPPIELEVDLTRSASAYSVEQWVSRLKQLQQQRAEELRFPLLFMCESCEDNAAVPCSIATTTKSGTSVPSSLLSLVMPLVRETMLFLEARAILSNGLSVGETSGLAGPRQWEELRTFYRALEHMELATVNPVNEVELAPMEQQLKSRNPSIAQTVLDVLTTTIFSEEKREYVRNLLDALVSDEEDLEVRPERNSWAALRRCDISNHSSTSTRWLCSHHAPFGS
ncbi:hypothetical protein PRNP1_011456 [Phytophthora ramorum]